MASSKQFQEKLKQGDLPEALKAALTNIIQLNITTSVIPADSSGADSSGTDGETYPRIRTCMNIVDGDIETEIDRRFLEQGPYAELREFHTRQVHEGHHTIKTNIASLQKLLSVFAQTLTAPSSGTQPAPVRSLDLESPAIRPPAGRPEGGSGISARVDDAIESDKAEINKAEINKAEINRADTNKADINKTDTNKTDTNKADKNVSTSPVTAFTPAPASSVTPISQPSGSNVAGIAAVSVGAVASVSGNFQLDSPPAEDVVLEIEAGDNAFDRPPELSDFPNDLDALPDLRLEEELPEPTADFYPEDLVASSIEESSIQDSSIEDSSIEDLSIEDSSAQELDIQEDNPLSDLEFGDLAVDYSEQPPTQSLSPLSDLTLDSSDLDQDANTFPDVFSDLSDAAAGKETELEAEQEAEFETDFETDFELELETDQAYLSLGSSDLASPEPDSSLGDLALAEESDAPEEEPLDFSLDFDSLDTTDAPEETPLDFSDLDLEGDSSDRSPEPPLALDLPLTESQDTLLDIELDPEPHEPETTTDPTPELQPISEVSQGSSQEIGLGDFSRSASPSPEPVFSELISSSQAVDLPDSVDIQPDDLTSNQPDRQPEILGSELQFDAEIPLDALDIPLYEPDLLADLELETALPSATVLAGDDREIEAPIELQTSSSDPFADLAFDDDFSAEEAVNPHPEAPSLPQENLIAPLETSELDLLDDFDSDLWDEAPASTSLKEEGTSHDSGYEDPLDLAEETDFEVDPLKELEFPSSESDTGIDLLEDQDPLDDLFGDSSLDELGRLTPEDSEESDLNIPDPFKGLDELEDDPFEGLDELEDDPFANLSLDGEESSLGA